jgi:aminoglycoside 6-adenylyltransferase
MDLPDEKAFRDTVNEFWWLTLYVNKGICRKELHTAWTFYCALLEQTDRCLVWLLHTQKKDAGKFMGKLDTVLDETSYQHYLSLYPKMDLGDIADKEFLIMDAFELISNQLADALGFGFPKEDTVGIRALIRDRLASSKLT